MGNMVTGYQINFELLFIPNIFFNIELLFALTRKKPGTYGMKQEVCMKSYKTRFLFLAMNSM